MLVVQLNHTSIRAVKQVSYICLLSVMNRKVTRLEESIPTSPDEGKQ